MFSLTNLILIYDLVSAKYIIFSEYICAVNVLKWRPAARPKNTLDSSLEKSMDDSHPQLASLSFQWYNNFCTYEHLLVVNLLFLQEAIGVDGLYTLKGLNGEIGFI